MSYVQLLSSNLTVIVYPSGYNFLNQFWHTCQPPELLWVEITPSHNFLVGDNT